LIHLKLEFGIFQRIIVNPSIAGVLLAHSQSPPKSSQTYCIISQSHPIISYHIPFHSIPQEKGSISKHEEHFDRFLQEHDGAFVERPGLLPRRQHPSGHAHEHPKLVRKCRRGQTQQPLGIIVAAVVLFGVVEKRISPWPLRRR